MQVKTRRGFSRREGPLVDSLGHLGQTPAGPHVAQSSLKYLPYDWADDVEPTYEELAEVDAALYSVEPVSEPDPETVAAWANTYAVKRALEATGEPDGTSKWILDFTSHLFAITDAIGDRISRADRDHLIEIACTWRNEDYGRIGLGNPRRGAPTSSAIGEMLEHIDLPHAAWYLNIDEHELCKLRWPKADPHKMAAAARDYANNDTHKYECAMAAGVGLRAFDQYIAAYRIEPAWKLRVAELVEAGETLTKRVAKVLRTEGFTVASERVRREIDRQRGAVAA